MTNALTCLKKPWKERKTAYLRHLEIVYDTEALVISAADKIHNLSSIVVDYNDVR